MLRRLVVALLLVVSLPVLAAELTPDDVAAIEAEQARAVAAVDEKYKGKLSAAQLKEQQKERAAAQKAVLEARGVSAVDFMKASTKMSPDGRAAVDAKKKALEKADEDAKKKPEAGAGKDVVIEKGERNEAAEMDKKMGLGAGKK